MQQQQQQQQKEQQQRGSRGRRKSARPFAEIRVRDKNMKMQLQLSSTCAKFDRDRSTCARDNEKNERNILEDLAHIIDAKLTLSVDDWFNKRRIRQASCLPDLPRRRRIRVGDAADGTANEAEEEEDDGDSAMRLLDRQRILEAKRTDWLGVTSVPPRLLPRPATAAAAARVAAAFAADSGDLLPLLAGATGNAAAAGGDHASSAAAPTAAAAAAMAPAMLSSAAVGRQKSAGLPVLRKG